MVADIWPSLRLLGNIWAWSANSLWGRWRIGIGGGMLLWIDGHSITWVVPFWLRDWMRGDDYEGELEAIHGLLVVFATIASQPAADQSWLLRRGRQLARTERR